MSEFKGTKGEWRFFNDGRYCEIQIEKPLRSICAINNNIVEYKENAKLIAAAPEMLETINELLALLEFHGYQNSTEIYKAKQLLTKITE